MFKTTAIKRISLNNDILNANMTLFKMSLSWKIITSCLCHDNLTLNEVKLSWHWLS